MEHRIQSQEQWVLYRLERFYARQEHLEAVTNVLGGHTTLSLRLIDWFVTNYSKKYNVSFLTSDNRHVKVYLEYKSHLKAYSKKLFDPFCRAKRIKFHDIETTVGQLNFFEWAVRDEILTYIGAHHTEIHRDMDARLHEEKDPDSPRKRHELSHSATNSLKRHDVRVTIRFD